MRSTVVGEFCGAWYTSGAPSPWSVWGVCLTACSSFFCLHWSVGGRYFTACLVSLLFALVSMGSVLSCLFSLSFVCIGQCGEESVCSTGATHFLAKPQSWGAAPRFGGFPPKFTPGRAGPPIAPPAPKTCTVTQTYKSGSPAVSGDGEGRWRCCWAHRENENYSHQCAQSRPAHPPPPKLAQ
jgi:hypothetical protein